MTNRSGYLPLPPNGSQGFYVYKRLKELDSTPRNAPIGIIVSRSFATDLPSCSLSRAFYLAKKPSIVLHLYHILVQIKDNGGLRSFVQLAQICTDCTVFGNTESQAEDKKIEYLIIFCPK